MAGLRQDADPEEDAEQAIGLGFSGGVAQVHGEQLGNIGVPVQWQPRVLRRAAVCSEFPRSRRVARGLASSWLGGSLRSDRRRLYSPRVH
jgi:hypothetical protein